MLSLYRRIKHLHAQLAAQELAVITAGAGSAPTLIFPETCVSPVRGALCQTYRGLQEHLCSQLGLCWCPRPSLPCRRSVSPLRSGRACWLWVGAVVSMPVIPQENWKRCRGLRVRGNSDGPGLPLRRCHVLQLVMAGLGTSTLASASLELQPSHSCSATCPAHRSVGVHMLGRAEYRCGQGEEEGLGQGFLFGPLLILLLLESLWLWFGLVWF